MGPVLPVNVMSNSRNPVTDPIPRLFFSYYVPALTSMLSVTLHQAINGLILARWVGREGVTAVGLFGSVFTVLIAMVLALMIGSGIMVSKSLGAGDHSRAQSVFQFTTTVALVFGGLVALLAPLFSYDIAIMLAGDGNVLLIGQTHDYIFWSFLWMPFFFLRMLGGNFLSNDRAPHIARNASLIAVVCNIILDVLLVIIVPLGVAGASIATGVSVIISLIYVFYYLWKGNSVLSVRSFKFQLRLSEWKEMLRYGVPSFLSEISFSLGLIVINIALVNYGEAAVSAFGIINHLSFIFLRLFTAAMISVLPIMSFNIGAQRRDRVLAVTRFSLGFTLVVAVIVYASCFVFAPELIYLFSGSTADQFISIAISAMSLYFLLFAVAGPNFILAAYLQATGKVFLSSTLNVLKGVVIVAVALYVGDALDLQLSGIWLSRSVAEITAFLIVASIMIIKWRQYFSNIA